MATASLSFSFDVTGVVRTADVPTRINIKKRREHIVYRTLSDDDNINIAYVIGQETKPATNFFITDRSTSLTQNRIPSTQQVYTETTGSLLLNVNKFLVTDVFTAEIPTQPATPLFYAHTLAFFNNTLSDFSERTLLGFEFVDQDFITRKVSEVKSDTTLGVIYNNLVNSYDTATGELNLSYIRYTVRTSGVTRVHYELVNNRPVFTQASFDDIDDFGNILSGRKVYLIEELVVGSQFQVSLPGVATYAYKELPESRLRLLPPTALTVDQPWFPRVTNGQFIASQRRNQNTTANYRYRIAEFDTQLFFPYPPYKTQTEQRAVILTKTLLQTPKNIVNDVEQDFYIDVLVFDKNETPKYAYTTNTTKLDQVYTDDVSWTAGIVSVDEANGFVEVTGPLATDDIIEATYVAEETDYELIAVDFNPTNNLNIHNQRVVFYISPETTFTGDLDNTLFYLVVDSLGRIQYSSQAEDNAGSIDYATQKLLAEDFNTTGLPTHTFYYDIESTESGLNSRVSGVHTAAIDEFSFIDKYTVDSVLLQQTLYPSGFAGQNLIDNPRFLVLGDVYVGSNQAPHALTTFDVRVQGGGIKERLYEDALDVQPEVSWYWDSIGNRLYPSVGAFYIEVPESIHADFGGNYTQDQLFSLISRHMALGSYPVIRTYGINPVITERTSSSGQIHFCWPSYGIETTYNVYLSTTIDGVYQAQNGSVLTDVSSGNCITVTGLNPATKYYVYVEALRGDAEASPGPKVSVTTTAINA